MPHVSYLPLAVFWDAQIVRWGVWVGLVALTIALLLLIRTRWGQSQPLSKCVVLSLLGHLLLAIYISTVDIVTATVGSPQGRGIQVSLADPGAPDGRSNNEADLEPWNAVSGQGPDAGFGPTGNWSLARTPLEHPPLAPATNAEPQRAPVAPPSNVAPGAQLIGVLPAVSESGTDVAAPDLATAIPSRITSATISAPQPIEAGSAPPMVANPIVPPPVPLAPVQPGGNGNAAPLEDHSKPFDTLRTPVPAGGAGRGGGGHTGDAPGGAGSPQGTPDVFRNRVGDHAITGKGFGVTQESEAAVKEALRYLASMQSADGRWDPRRLSGGAGLASDRQDRNSAGLQADTAITGLALLAFLAAGHTHEQGTHQETVRHALEYLLAVQQADGNLGTSNNLYERMYSHAMATCALSEAYAMSHDERLRQPVQRAIGFTRASQDRTTGGWRYTRGDPGDTSQLGWQVMSLKSAALGGIPMPDDARRGIQKFLKSVEDGRDRGKARYQPQGQFVAAKPSTRSMTAEALACRQFMGIVDSPEALAEACAFILDEVPGAGVTNHYYWYYASLALCQVQGESWRKWNEALQKKLLATQRRDGEMKGSWDPDPVWGGCGGRGYSTALAALSLEVPYRFLPLHAGQDRTAK